jgi:hypothetical protein
MALTQQEVLAALGKEAQISGGVIMVYRGGKHINVTGFKDGVFFVTPEGEEVLGTPQVSVDGVDVVKAPTKKKPKDGGLAIQDAEIVE